MKESNKLLLVLFFIFFIMILLSYKEIKRTYDYFSLTEWFQGVCGAKSDDATEDFCDIDITGLPSTPDNLTIFFSIMHSNIFYYLSDFAPILLLIFSTFTLNKLMKSKYLYYYVEREKYSNFIKSIFVHSYKFVLVVPFIILSVYLLSSIISGHNIKVLTEIARIATFSKVHYETKGFIVLYGLNIILLWLFYINLGLIIQSKNRKLVFNILEYYIIYYLLEMLSENFSVYCWLGNMYTLSNYSIYYSLFCTFGYFVLSFIGVIFCYKNKEKMLNRVGV